MRWAVLRWLLPVGLLLGATLAYAHDPHALLFDDKQALAYSQGAIGQSTSDQHFIATRGQDVSLAALRGRPVILNLIYTSCDHICPMIMENVARAVDLADGALGGQRFVVLTVGFDTKVDTPARMRDFAHAHGIDRPDWHLVSGQPNAIARLAEETGFLFSARAGGFDHLAQTTILDRDGRVYRQIYGNDFALPTLVEPLKDLVFNRPRETGMLSGLMNRVRLLCTIYDPASGRYRFSYAIFIGITVGAASLIGVGIAILRMWRQHRPVTHDGVGV